MSADHQHAAGETVCGRMVLAIFLAHLNHIQFFRSVLIFRYTYQKAVHLNSLFSVKVKLLSTIKYFIYWENLPIAQL